MAAIAKKSKLTANLSTRTLYLVVVSIFATALAAMVGFLFIVGVGFPFSLMAAFFLPQVLGWLWNGALFAAPVTLILLPGVVLLGHRYPVALYFMLPLIGLVGGIIAMKMWLNIGTYSPEFAGLAKTYLAFELPTSKHLGDELGVLTGAIAGLFAGAFFSAAVREMRR